MLTDLKQQGYLKSSKSGSELTKMGHGYIETLFKKYDILDLQEVNLRLFGIDANSFIIHLQNHSIPKPVVELRDIAVKAGASGSIIVLFKNDRFIVPTVYSDLSLEHPDLAKILLYSFELSDENILIICFSKNKWRALEGCLAITLYLSKLRMNTKKNRIYHHMEG
jgi:hypothetical protein